MNIIKSGKFKHYASLILALALVAIIYRLLGCPIRRITGIPCPGCGMTHSIYGILTGRWQYAWDCNPFGYVFPIYVGFFLFRKRLPERLKKALVISFISLIVGIYLVRMFNPNCLMVKPRIQRGLIYQGFMFLKNTFSSIK